MYLFERFWGAVTSIFNIVFLSPLQDGIDNRSPLGIPSTVAPPLHETAGPIFRPPGAPTDSDFKCNDTNMPGWVDCSILDRKCWLQNSKNISERYDITTDYESEMPTGVFRNYELNLADGSYDADGINFDAAKLFNNIYPCPWIQACWGDT